MYRVFSEDAYLRPYTEPVTVDLDKSILTEAGTIDPNLAQSATTERKKHHSVLLELCKKVPSNECEQSSLYKLMKTIEQQRESKTVLIEIFETTKNIPNDVCIEYK